MNEWWRNAGETRDDWYTGVSMTIPEGAVRQDQSVDIYLAVLRDDKDRPKLTGFIFFS